MIRTRKASVVWPVPWAENTHFMIRPGDVIERGELEADLADLNAGRVFDFQLEEAFSAGVAALLKDHPDDIARIEEVTAAVKEGQEIGAEDRDLLEGARELIKEHWQPYRTLVAQAARRNELVPTLSLMRFCTGWEGKDLPPFAKGPDDLASLDAIGALPPLMLRLAGMRAYNMLYPQPATPDEPGDEGNSERPLQSDKSPRPSSSDTQRKGGKSAGGSGKKTRSSSSPGGRSRSSTSSSTAAGTGGSPS